MHQLLVAEKVGGFYRRAEKLAAKFPKRFGVIFFDLVERVGPRSNDERTNAILEHAAKRTAPLLQTEFRCLPATAGKRIDIPEFQRRKAAGRLAARPQRFLQIPFRRPKVSGRDGRWTSLMRPAFDRVVIVPKVVFAGRGTPSHLGGPTPFSLSGYWIEQYAQGRGPPGFDRLIPALQSQTIARPPGENAGTGLFCASGSGDNRYYHFIVSTLPSLRWYRDLQLDEPILLPHLHDGLQQVSAEATALVLEALEIPPERVLRRRDVESKVFPYAILTPVLYNSERTVEFYRSVLLDRLERQRQLANFPSDRRFVYISRRNAVRRKIENEEEIIASIQALGFYVAYCEEMSFIDQVSLFSQARVIVGAHGAGFVNAAFAKPGASLIEMFTQGSEEFRWLAANAGHSFSRVPVELRTGSAGQREWFLGDIGAVKSLCVQAMKKVEREPK
ncbi:MAG: DUF563 domain-containing protein [Alphaproteobacteria bacterium]